MDGLILSLTMSDTKTGSTQFDHFEKSICNFSQKYRQLGGLGPVQFSQKFRLDQHLGSDHGSSLWRSVWNQ